MIQIALGFILKGVLFVLSYLQIPFLGSFFGKDEFGLWFTYLSFYNWFILFDFGIGHGLKNLLSEKIALDDLDGIRETTSTGLSISFLFSIALLFIYLIAEPFINYDKIFITAIPPEIVRISLNYTVYTCLLLFCNNAFGAIINASQKTSYTNVLNLIVNFCLILSIPLYQVFDVHQNPILYLSKVNFYLYLITFLGTSIYFLTQNRIFIPSFSSAKKRIANTIMITGWKFFLIQVTVLIIFPLDSFLISSLVSTSESGRYNLIIKLFSYSVVFMAIINQTSWPAYTEAFHKKDFLWIRNTFKKINLSAGLIIATLFPVAFFATSIISLWSGTGYHYATLEIITFAGMQVFYITSFNLTTLLYAINELGSQMYIGIVLVLLKAGVMYYLYDQQIVSIWSITFLSTVLFLLLSACNLMIISKKLKGIAI